MYWKCAADHSLLQSRGDSVRYLERPVGSSQQFDPRDQPSLRYLILARTEDDAIRTAYRTCMTNALTRDRLEKAPKYRKGSDWAWSRENDARVYDYYGAAPYWGM